MARSYGIVRPSFWIGKTGVMLRKHDPSVSLVALYLQTSPHANMIGLYHLPLIYVAHETGLHVRQVDDAIVVLERDGFCTYARETEWVFVTEMARCQIADELKPRDNRVKNIRKELEKAPPHLVELFLERYEGPFSLKKGPPRAPFKPGSGSGSGSGSDTGSGSGSGSGSRQVAPVVVSKGGGRESKWEPGGPITSEVGFVAAVGKLGLAVQVPMKERAEARRLLEAGPIEPHEYEPFVETAKKKQRPVAYLLGCISRARDEAAEVAAKGPANGPAPKPQQDYTVGSVDCDGFDYDEDGEF